MANRGVSSLYEAGLRPVRYGILLTFTETCTLLFLICLEYRFKRLHYIVLQPI